MRVWLVASFGAVPMWRSVARPGARSGRSLVPGAAFVLGGPDPMPTFGQSVEQSVQVGTIAGLDGQLDVGRPRVHRRVEPSVDDLDDVATEGAHVRGDRAQA